MKLVLIIALIYLCMIPEFKSLSSKEFAEKLYHKLEETIALGFEKIEKDMKKKADKVMISYDVNSTKSSPKVILHICFVLNGSLPTPSWDKFEPI